MRVNWARELWLWAQYFLFSFVAATAALMLETQAEWEERRMNNPPPPGLADDPYSGLEVLKSFGGFYFWWFFIFLGFGLMRLLILFVAGRDWARGR